MRLRNRYFFESQLSLGRLDENNNKQYQTDKYEGLLNYFMMVSYKAAFFVLTVALLNSTINAFAPISPITKNVNSALNKSNDVPVLKMVEGGATANEYYDGEQKLHGTLYNHQQRFLGCICLRNYILFYVFLTMNTTLIWQRCSYRTSPRPSVPSSTQSYYLHRDATRPCRN